MALHADLEALLGAMSPEDAKAQRTIFEKTPALADGYLRQADYDRQMNASKEKVRVAEESATTWKKWGEENYPKHQTMMKDYKEMETKVSTLEHQVKTAAATGGDMTPEQIAELELNVVKKIGESGYMTKEQIDAAIKTEGAKVAAETIKPIADQFLGNTWPAAMEVTNQTIEVSFAHQAEFGKPLTRDDRIKISKLMTEKGFTTVTDAYDAYVSADREAVKIAKAKGEGKAEGVEEGKKSVTPSVPGVTTAGQELGHLQFSMVERAKTAQANNSGEIGDNSAAAAAAAELRAEGKA